MNLFSHISWGLYLFSLSVLLVIYYAGVFTYIWVQAHQVIHKDLEEEEELMAAASVLPLANKMLLTELEESAIGSMIPSGMKQFIPHEQEGTDMKELIEDRLIDKANFLDQVSECYKSEYKSI